MDAQSKVKSSHLDNLRKQVKLTSFQMMRQLKNTLSKEFEGRNFVLYRKIRSQALTSLKKKHRSINSINSLTLQLKNPQSRQSKAFEVKKIQSKSYSTIQQIPQPIHSRRFTLNQKEQFFQVFKQVPIKNFSFDVKQQNKSFRSKNKLKHPFKPLLTITQVNQKSTPNSKQQQINEKRKELHNRFSFSRHKFFDKRQHINPQVPKDNYRPWSGKNNNFLLQTSTYIDDEILPSIE